MGVLESLDVAQARERGVAGLGLHPELIGIDSPEATAAAVRRAASFLCPTSPRGIVRGVTESLEWLVDSVDLEEEVSATLDAVVNYGDLLELPNAGGPAAESSALFLASPAYVVRQSGSILLLGIPPEGQPIVGQDAIDLIEYERHVRSIRPRDLDAVQDLLSDYGLRRLAIDQWLATPRAVSPQDYLSAFDARLDVAAYPGVIEGLTIIDPAKSVTYYRGRWRAPTQRDRGRFVARRPRGYGAYLWCYADIEAGTPTRLIDLPLGGGMARACDEAWRLQAAADHVRGNPQVVRSKLLGDGNAIVQLFSPPPSWLQRRWDALGTPIIAPGALMSYRLRADEVGEEVDFVGRHLWMRGVAE